MQINFKEGKAPTLEEVLNQREKRVYLINQLLEDSKKTVICFKLNIPGPIKNNESISYLFNQALALLKETIDFEVKYFENGICGPEITACSELSAMDTKKLAIQFEETNFLTRLCDVDVYGVNGPVSRKDLGIEPRRCFICNNEAKACTRSRKHSVDELLTFISNQFL